MKVRFIGREYFLQSNYFSHHSANFAKKQKGKTMKMEKDHFNDKVLDKEKALSVIKTSYLNSYKVIVAGARDFADYAFMRKKT